MNRIARLIQLMRGPTVGIALSLLLCSALLRVLGESPSVLFEAIQLSLFDSFGLGYTLFYATPLIFTGLAVAIAFHAGLFNIGAEGQLYLGAIGIVMVGTLLPRLPPAFAIPLGICTSMLLGGLWGGIAGFLKAKRGSHEVIVTILLNFIAYSLVNYLILYVYKTPHNQNPETLPVGEGFILPKLSECFTLLNSDWFESTPVNLALAVAILVAIVCYFILYRSTWGYELRAVGKNRTASQFAGISVTKTTFLALAFSGSLAGLVGVNEVMGHHHRVVEGFSPQYGFTGIAVALLARNHPIGIILSAVLMGALHNSAREIEFLSDIVSKEVSLVLQGLLIAFVACGPFIDQNLSKLRLKLFQRKAQPLKQEVSQA